MIIGIVLFIFLYGLINFLVGRRILKSLNNKKHINGKFFWTIFIFLSSSFIIYQVFKKVLPSLISKILSYIGSYYLAALFYILLFFMISFIFSYLLRKKEVKVDLYLISLIFALILLPIGTYFSNSTIVKNYDIKIDRKLNEELNIVMISDIHLGDIIGNNRLDKMVTKINSLNPDIVLIAGDLIDSDLDSVTRESMLDKLKEIESKYGTYFSLGNHDFYTGRAEGLTELVNYENTIVVRDNILLINNDFYLIGRDDATTNRLGAPRKTIPEIISTSPDFDDTKATILIDHNPDHIEDSIDNNIDLQVSGHTHKGQMFPINFITNSIFDIHYGYGKFKNTNVVVSSGFGTWGPPIRLGSRSEIVQINLHN